MNENDRRNSSVGRMARGCRRVVATPVWSSHAEDRVASIRKLLEVVRRTGAHSAQEEGKK